MKITHVTTRALRTPADNPLVVGLSAPTDTREFVTLELGTDQGAVGLGLTFFGGALTPALSAVDIACWDLKGKAMGQSVCALLGNGSRRTPAAPSCVRTRSTISPR